MSLPYCSRTLSCNGRSFAAFVHSHSPCDETVRYRYRVGVLLFLLAVVTYLDRVCISVAGPRIQEYLHIGPQQWGWVVGAFALARPKWGSRESGPTPPVDTQETRRERRTPRTDS